METSVQEKANSQLINDIEAVAKYKDKQAFSRLFDRLAPMIRAFSLKAQPGATLMADEVAQEVMIKIWKNAAKYRPEKAAVSTWVFTLARNARVDYLRKNGRHQSNIDPDFLWPDIVEEDSDPFFALQQQHSKELIQENFKKIPHDQQQVLSKVFLEGKTHQEAAEDLYLPLGTVKSRVRLALQRLSVLVKRHSL